MIVILVLQLRQPKKLLNSRVAINLLYYENLFQNQGSSSNLPNRAVTFKRLQKYISFMQVRSAQFKT